MTILLNIIKYFTSFAFVVLLSGLFAQQSWGLYQLVFHEPSGSWLDLSDLVGFMLNYTLLVPFVLVLLGERRKYWLTTIFLIPILLFELSSDFRFVMVDVSLIAAGLATGFLIRYIADRTLGKIPSFEPLKKYF